MDMLRMIFGSPETTSSGPSKGRAGTTPGQEQIKLTPAAFDQVFGDNSSSRKRGASVRH